MGVEPRNNEMYSVGRSQSRWHSSPRGRRGFQIISVVLCAVALLASHALFDYVREMYFQRNFISVIYAPAVEIERFRESLSSSMQSPIEGSANDDQLQQAEQSTMPSYAIFTSPKPFEGDALIAQKIAVETWLSINFPPSFVVFMVGSEEEKDLMATTVSGWRDEFPSTQIIVQTVDSTFKGIPLFNAMFYTTMEAGVWLQAQITILMNTDILFDSDSVTLTLSRAHSRFSNYFLIAARFDVNFANITADSADATLHTYGGVDLWAWNTPGKTAQGDVVKGAALLHGRIPGFINGRGKYDNWIVHEVISAGTHEVVDVSEAINIKHVAHSYGHVDSSKSSKGTSDQWKTVSKWSTGKNTQFEQRLNVFLSHSYGTYKNQMGTTLHAKWKMIHCDEPLLDKICLVKRLRPNNCPCEHSPFVHATQTDVTDMVCGSQRFLSAGMISQERREEYNIPVFTKLSASPPSYGLPFTLDQLLSTRAKELSNLGTVVVLGANMGYFDLLLNKVCNLKRLGVNNYIIAAFDLETYRFAYAHGLPVFVGFSNAMSETQLSKDKPAKDYGTAEFNHLTKMKSRIVLNVIQKGISALWSDLDMIWFENPLDYIEGILDDADIFVQSNAPDEESANSYRRINSGFYFVKSQPKTVAAIQEIVDHASHSLLSEQPSFYEVLCCSGGHNEANTSNGKGECAHGEARCFYRPQSSKSIVSTYFLSRDLFPNGSTGNFWKSSKVISAVAKENGMIAIHNNWIKGHDAKVARQKHHGLWYINEITETCTFEGGPDLTQATAMINETPDQSDDPLLNIARKI